MELFQPNAAQFCEAQAGSVGEFENCLVAKGLRSFRRFGREQFFDFVAGERFGQAFPTSWKGQIFSDVGW